MGVKHITMKANNLTFSIYYFHYQNIKYSVRAAPIYCLVITFIIEEFMIYKVIYLYTNLFIY